MTDLYYRFPSSQTDIQVRIAHLRGRAEQLSKVAANLPDRVVHDLACLYASFAGCMELLAKQLPYKAGDRVQLAKAPTCEGGWFGSKHFLVIGAVATVSFVELDHLMRHWTLYLTFDNESHVCGFAYEGNKAGDLVPIPPERRHVFGFPDHFVVPLGSTLPTPAVHDRDRGDEDRAVP